MTLAERKIALRNQMLSKAGELPARYMIDAGNAICSGVTTLPEYRQAKTVFCFVGVANEVNTRPILQDALSSGKTLCVPKCVAKGVMEARQITDFDQLSKGKFGLMEPADTCGLVLPSEIDFAVIPCSTCNLSGHRLGFGGGYYDRYLPGAGFFTCMICRNELLTEDIPMEAHDQVTDMVITEDRIVSLRFELNITDLGGDGRGIGKVSGRTIFVSGDDTLRPVPGDTVRAEIVQVKRRYTFAKILAVNSASPYRVKSFCDYSGRCGGCTLLEMRYEAQLALKEKQLRDKLVHIAGLRDPNILPAIGMEIPLRYRNKAQMPVSPDGAGFYHKKSRKVVDCGSCPVCVSPAEALLGALRDFMRENRVSAYDASTGQGLIRHLIVRAAEHTGEIMVIVVVNGGGIPNHDRLLRMMDDAVSGMSDERSGVPYRLKSVVLNRNTKMTAGVMGEKCILLAGKRTITDQIADLRVEISPMSFYQINAIQARRLYDLILHYAALTGKETVLDICCGIGIIGLLCAANAREVVGIESVKDAVADANRNAIINGAANARFICGRAEEQLPELLRSGFAADVVILDPPRTGCKPKLLEAAARANPEKIIYVSCDPATLARDIKALCAMGYEFREAVPVDMFPHTTHIEAVVLLQRRDLCH